MPIVVVGHVDHGKSTIVGRVLADSGSLPEGKLEQVRELCARTSKPFEYAFLLDALKDERDQGITIDSARVFFKSRRRHYVIIDAPGHVEFLKNMITGAARADAALLVIDAREGVQRELAPPRHHAVDAGRRRTSRCWSTRWTWSAGPRAPSPPSTAEMTHVPRAAQRHRGGVPAGVGP